MKRILQIFVVIIVIAFGVLVLLQLIPAQSISADFARVDAPVQTTVTWNSAETEALLRAACYDCHSNETRSPWYASIAPVAWLVNKDVNEGRHALNLSELGRRFEIDEMIEQIQRGEMPPTIYTIMHPEANLTQEQKAALIAGLEQGATVNRVADGASSGSPAAPAITSTESASSGESQSDSDSDDDAGGNTESGETPSGSGG